ncbi:MAG: 16S rRNA (cytidine(1402)-2'-O)-methyltransferase [Leptolyngbyaceae bacterium]|nr:16S rRNA (cytidine(1402)-2'-O)-methyltransferase [Leptolyngbyaceae bacterium]
MDDNSLHPGVLYVVATPIGNLDDMTFRAIATLKQASLIAAEDTRHTAKLLNHFEISTPQISYHDHNRLSRIPDLIHRLSQGQTIALVSDAGMPGVSDPGYELVKACIEAEIAVIPIPGATAAITALSVSGLPTAQFVFEGFLPTKGKERRDRLELLKAEMRTLIFYEAPHRLVQTLNDFAAVFGGDRLIVLGRELTKRYEEVWRGTVEGAIAHYDTQNPMGEYTLVLAGASPQTLELTDDALRDELTYLLSQGLSRSRASRELSQQTALPRRRIYQLALTISDEEISP